MTGVAGSIRVCGMSIALAIGCGSFSGSLAGRPAQERKAFGPKDSFRRMADGKRWTTNNLNVNIVPSHCYEDAERNCRQYGRLYTWESARRACQSLGDGWRLPTNEEWRQLAKHYGGIREESDDAGKAAYQSLLTGGRSGFNALLGGNRSDDGQYARLEAHGFYWTSSESDPDTAWFYNFGKGALSLNRHRDGGKHMAISVRCVSE